MEMTTNFHTKLESKAIYKTSNKDLTPESTNVCDEELCGNEMLESNKRNDLYSCHIKQEPKHNLDVFSEIKTDPKNHKLNPNLNFFTTDLHSHSNYAPNMNLSPQTKTDQPSDSAEDKVGISKPDTGNIILTKGGQEGKSSNCSDLKHTSIKYVNDPTNKDLATNKSTGTFYMKKAIEHKIFTTKLLDQNAFYLNSSNSYPVGEPNIKEPNSSVKDLSFTMKPKPVLSEITQTTAKVSIGNTTISVPLLKPVTSNKYIQEPIAGNIGKKTQSVLQTRKIIQPKNIKTSTTLSVNHGPKINPPTIVSLSQIHIKPLTNSKIVQATVVSNKINLQNSIEASNQPTSTPAQLKPKVISDETFHGKSNEPFESLNQNSDNEEPLISDVAEISKNVLQLKSYGSEKEKRCNISSSKINVNYVQNSENISLPKSKTIILPENASRLVTKDKLVNNSTSVILSQDGKILKKRFEDEITAVDALSGPQTTISAIYTSSIPSVGEPILTTSIVNSVTSSIATGCNKLVSSYSNSPKTTSLMISKNSSLESFNETSPVMIRTQCQIKTSICNDIPNHYQKPNSIHIKATQNEVLPLSKSLVIPVNTSVIIDKIQCNDIFVHCEQSNIDDSLMKELINSRNEKNDQELSIPLKSHFDPTYMDTWKPITKFDLSEQNNENTTQHLAPTISENCNMLDKKNHLVNIGHDVRLNSDDMHTTNTALKIDDDSPNILLKQLLKNSSCYNQVIPNLSSTPISDVSQVISSRKLINVRAPSLGLVSSLEAQLARPVIPPVSTSTEISTNCLKSEPLKKKDGTENVLLDCRARQAVKVISKETSFVSNPKLCSNIQTSESSSIITKTLLTTCTDNNNIINSTSPNAKLTSPRYEISNACNISAFSSFDGSMETIELHKKLKFQSTQTFLGKDAKDVLISGQNEINPELLRSINENSISEVNKKYNHCSETPKSSAPFTVKHYGNRFTGEKWTDNNISNKINTSGKNAQILDTLQTLNLTYSSSESACSASTKDSQTHQNNTSTISRDLGNYKTEDTIDLKKKKKRKREFSGNHSRGDITNSSQVNFTKKRLRKCLKLDEDYDIFMNNLVLQMKNMNTLNILEPHLRLEIARLNVHNSNSNHNVLQNKDLLKKIGDDKRNLHLQDRFDCYEKQSFGFVKKPNNIQIQNDFYDQEFLNYSLDSVGKKFKKLLNSKKNCNFDWSENIFGKNYVSNVVKGSQCNLYSQDFPGLLVLHSTGQNVGRRSPIIPFIKPVPVKYDSFGAFSSSGRNSRSFIKVDFLTCPPEMDCDAKKPINSKPSGNKSNLTVILTVSSIEIVSVLKELANILSITPITSYKLLTECRIANMPPKKESLAVLDKEETSPDIQHILNGTVKFCRNCGLSSTRITASNSRNNLHTCSQKLREMLPSSGYFCQKSCLINFFNRNTTLSKKSSLKGTMFYNFHKNKILVSKACGAKKWGFKKFALTCPATRTRSKRSYRGIESFMCELNITLSPSYIDQSLRKYKGNIEDVSRFCRLCKKKGDDICTNSSRLLYVDVDKWVHLNCALWANDVNESSFGCLINVEKALNCGHRQLCCVCHDSGATIICSKSRCDGSYHLLCAKKQHWMCIKTHFSQCQSHYIKTPKEKELSELSSKRRVFIERDKKKMYDVIMQPNSFRYLLRIGSVIYLNIGQLPHQLKEFHTTNCIYPVGYKAIRFYWSMKYPTKRCRYLCTISELQNRPEFIVNVQDHNESNIILKDCSPNVLWKQILEQITALQCQKSLFKIFPKYISGDEFFGLNEPRIVEILESLPGVDNLSNYCFKYGQNSVSNTHLHSSGAARTEPQQKQVLGPRKPHTQRSASSASYLNSRLSMLGEVTCPYSKQFVHSKSSQYKKMNQEWRNNVYLARSKIQGLGLYAARDIEKHAMVIEYIGEVIRTEVSEIREKQYESKNRGIYMFRLDEDRIVDATLSGGLARYINHSCNPNCVTEIVEVERELRIIIFAKRRISRGEELSYDYKFDIEDDANKLACMCGAFNCKKRMN